jgi:hypothetical protein
MMSRVHPGQNQLCIAVQGAPVGDDTMKMLLLFGGILGARSPLG